MPDQRTEFEIALKDSASAELRLIAQYMRDIIGVARNMSEVSGTGMEKFGKSIEGATEKIKKSRDELGVVGSFFTGFAKGLLAPLGSIYALEKFGRALYDVSTQRIQMELFANSVGFTTKQISVMSQTMGNMGASGAEAKQAIAGLGHAFREAEATGVGSKLIVTLNTMGEGAWASNLLKMIQSGDFAQATTMLQEKFGTWTRAAQFYFTSQTGINEQLLEHWKKYNEGVKAEYEVNLQNTETFVRRSNAIMTLFSNIFKGAVDQTLGQINRLHTSDEWKKFMESAERGAIKGLEASDVPNSLIGRGGKYRLEGEGGPGSESSTPTPFSDWLEKKFRGKRGGGDKLGGEFGSDVLAGGSGDDLLKTEEDSNRTLKQIRDMLDPSRGVMGGGGQIFRPGIRQATGGGGGGAGGGGLGGGGGGAGGAGASGGVDGAGPSGSGPGGGGLPESPAAGGEGGSAFLAEKRGPFAEQLKDSGTRDLVGGMLSSENPGAGPAVVESLFNRTELVNARRASQGLAPLSLRDMIMGHPSIGGGKSFYGPVRTGAINAHIARLRRDPAYAARINANINRALGGSNVVNSFTDQGSAGDPNYNAAGGHTDINRERFNTWSFPGAAAWQNQRRRDVGESQRQSVDGAARKGGDAFEMGTAAITVDFRNMPKGVRTEGKVEGVFKDLEMRSTPDAAKAGGGNQDFNTWSYE